MTKMCPKCGISKSVSEFSIRRCRADGRNPYCHRCQLDYDRKYRAVNADALAAKRKAYRVTNLEVIKERDRTYHEANKDRFRESSASRLLKRQYGLTLDDYTQMLEDQGGLCANPGCFNEPPVGRRFAVDHDHACCSGSKKSCGKCVRGLLCGNCNRALGLLSEDVKRIRGLADYLESKK